MYYGDKEDRRISMFYPRCWDSTIVMQVITETTYKHKRKNASRS